MELKWKKDLNEEALVELANEALAQIDKMRYDAEMSEDSIQKKKVQSVLSFLTQPYSDGVGFLLFISMFGFFA